MKIINKYCLAAFLPLFISSTFLSATENKAHTEAAVMQSSEGKIIWADLYTGNVQGSIDFYTNTFGWTQKNFGEGNARYHLLYDADQPIAGVIKRPAERNQTANALWIGSIGTDDVQASVDKASNNNGTVIFQPHDFALYGKRAVIADPQGAVIAFLDLDEQNIAHQNISKKWDWAQLFSVNTQKAADFYQATFNYSTEDVANVENSFYLIQQQEVRASIVSMPAEFEQRDRWVNFITVANLANVLARATENGAEVIYQPQGASLAIIVDPNGAILGLTEQESE